MQEVVTLLLWRMYKYFSMYTYINCKLLFLQGKCQRKEPPCKYLHPPQHLKEQLLQNGRQNLAIK